jgi:hypothetical protein
MVTPRTARSETERDISLDEEKSIGIKEKNREKHTIKRQGTGSSTALLPVYVDDDSSEHFIVPPKTTRDLITEVIHAVDDPTLNPWTFRVWFLGENPPKHCKTMAHKRCMEYRMTVHLSRRTDGQIVD